jgi:Na+-transporting NADH:ubiquinone oxidoreductase subunit C
MKRHGVLYTVVFTGGMGFALTFLLSAAHTVTIPINQRNELALRQATVVRALDLPAASRQEVVALYNGLAQSATDGIYLTTEAGTRLVAKRFSGPGVWGEIEGAIALSADLERIVGVEILRHSETPGLGGRITERRFLEQFRGERVGPHGVTVRVRGPGNYDPEDAMVDGITGASGTTRAFAAILETEIREIRRLLSGTETVSKAD